MSIPILVSAARVSSGSWSCAIRISVKVGATSAGNFLLNKPMEFPFPKFSEQDKTLNYYCSIFYLFVENSGFPPITVLENQVRLVATRLGVPIRGCLTGLGSATRLRVRQLNEICQSPTVSFNHETRHQ